MPEGLAVCRVLWWCLKKRLPRRNSSRPDHQKVFPPWQDAPE
jgi:hypothetical protein